MKNNKNLSIITYIVVLFFYCTESSLANGCSSNIDKYYNEYKIELLNYWWSEKVKDGGSMPHIMPTSKKSGDQNGLRDLDETGIPQFWQMAQFNNFVFSDWIYTNSERDLDIIKKQWEFVKYIYPKEKDSSTFGLGGDGSGDQTINWSDDGAWKALYLMEVHIATHDPQAIYYLRAMIPRTIFRFRDPYSLPVYDGSTIVGDFSHSKYGITYIAGTHGDQAYSTPYEVGYALAAAYVYRETREKSYLLYAERYFHMVNKLFISESGNYFSQLGLDPSSKFYLKDEQSFFSFPREGLTNLAFGTQLGAVALATSLYNITKDDSYISYINKLLHSMLKRQNNWGFLSSTTKYKNVFLSYRDPWSDGFYFPFVAKYTIPLPGIDTDHLWRQALTRTYDSMKSNKIHFVDEHGQTHYMLSPDWGGDLDSQYGKGLIGHYKSYQSRFEAILHAGKKDVDSQAGAQQIMTSASTGDVAVAAQIIACLALTDD